MLLQEKYRSLQTPNLNLHRTVLLPPLYIQQHPTVASKHTLSTFLFGYPSVFIDIGLDPSSYQAYFNLSFCTFFLFFTLHTHICDAYSTLA